jgi:hypothetical protein
MLVNTTKSKMKATNRFGKLAGTTRIFRHNIYF